jgi:hypothetical protein
MRTKDALKVFRSFLEKRGIDLANTDPVSGIDLMIAFYADVRFSDVDLDEDGDMLLFQYGGPYSWSPAYFDLNITRQFITKTQGVFYQLSLSFLYVVTENSLQDNKWCKRVEEIDSFRNYIQSSAAIAWISNRSHDDYDLPYGQV